METIYHLGYKAIYRTDVSLTANLAVHYQQFGNAKIHQDITCYRRLYSEVFWVYAVYYSLQYSDKACVVHKVQVSLLGALRECGCTRERLRWNKCGLYSERQFPSLDGMELPFLST
jgi:hypothetical protein